MKVGFHDVDRWNYSEEIDCPYECAWKQWWRQENFSSLLKIRITPVHWRPDRDGRYSQEQLIA
jgi:hypothetical protein